MKLLIAGRGKGSWTMRGEQLGAAMGARVTTEPTDRDWQWADRVVLVKREAWRWAAHAHARKIPIVWDALDFWNQPADNRFAECLARERLNQALDAIRPALTIGATDAMAAAAGHVFGGAIGLPHHGRLGLVPTPARESFRVIGYDGNAMYLDRWAAALERLCAVRGWRFVINPPDLAAVDCLVALRGGSWDGWQCREWKSGVKLVNAIMAGRPIITQDTAAARELQPAGTIVHTVADLPLAIDSWVDWSRRQAVVDESRERAPAFTVEAIAARYHRLLAGIQEAARC